jgi:hypothetical protein
MAMSHRKSLPTPPLVFIAFTLAVLLAAPVFAQTAQSSPIPNRITAVVNDSNLVTLKGNVHPLAKPRYDRGAAPLSMPTGRIILVLQRSSQQQESLREYLESLQNSSSQSYHKWLSPAQFGAVYGISDSDLQAVEGWLQSQGFTIDKVPQSRDVIEFSGSISQLQNAFHTSIHTFAVNGETHFANTTDPQIPAALAPVVAGVAPLNDFRPKSHAKFGGTGKYDEQSHTIKPDLTLFDSSGNPYLYVVPADAATIYDTPNTNLNAKYTSGTTYDGTGITIGIAGDSNITMQDVANYRTAFLGETAANANVPTVIVDGNDPGLNGDEAEALLDNEISGGIAPKAKINFYTSDNTDLQSGLFLAIGRALDDNAVSILNVSFGECEAEEGNTENAFISNMWEQAAAQGISVTVSAGDNGSAGCDSDDSETAQNGLNVNGLASTPFNIAVGGTDYDALLATSTAFAQYVNITSSGTAPYYGTAKSYIPEEPWNNSTLPNTDISANVAYLQNGASNIVAGSGGLSSCVVQDSFGDCTEAYPKPSFQTSLTPNDQVRDLPDVSLLAANGFYGAIWAVCADNVANGSSTPGTDCQTTNGQLTSTSTISGYGGTSASSPAFAGMLALVEQKVGSRLGQADRIIYALAKSNYSTVFHDVTVGDNSVVCAPGSPNCNSANFLTGYNTGTAYDYASGLGSVDVKELVNEWSSVSLTPTTTSFEINGSTAAVTAVHGTNVTLKFSVSPSAATGDVSILDNADNANLYNNNSQGYFTLSGGTVSQAYNGLPGGSYTVNGYYGGDASHAGSASNGVNVNISPENSTTGLTVTGYDPTSSTQLTTGIPYGYFIVADATPYGTAEGAANTEGFATGSVAFLNGSTTLASTNIASNGTAALVSPSSAYTTALAPGSYSLTAKYAGDASYNASTSTADTFTVVKGSTAVSASASSTSIAASSSTTVTVLITTDSAGAYPTGTVTLTAGGKTVGTITAFTDGVVSAGTVAAQGTAVVQGSSLASGANTITATYSGDANYATSSGTVKVTVTGSTTASFTLSSNPNAFTIAAGATTGNTSIITVTPANSFTGNVALTSTVTGPSGATSLPTVTFSSTPVDITGTTALTSTATVKTTSTTTSGAYTVTVTGTSGTLTVSTTVTVTVTGTAPAGTYSLSASPLALSITAGSSGTSSISVTPSGGFTGNVTLSCSVSAPTNGVTCSVPTTPVDITGTSPGTATLTVTTASSSASNAPMKKLFTAAGGIALAMVLFFSIPARRRGWQTMLGLLIVIVSIAGIGCGSSNNGGGGGQSANYTVTVTGTSGTTTETTTVMATVTN